MANSKKLINYTGTLTNVSVPTAVNNVLVRDIANATFSSTSVATVNVDTYANDIQGAPWGADNVVWLKEPTCTISFNANGGSGSMSAQQANVGIAYKIPQCEFVGASRASFSTWAIDSISGSTIAPGTQYAFPKSTELYALWNVPEKWFDNNKSTWAEANADGWYGNGGYVSNFSSTKIDLSSVYNIPKIISKQTITTLLGRAFINDAFVSIGGKGIINIGDQTFQSCVNLQEVSFPECVSLGNSAFLKCEALVSVYLPKCSIVQSETFYLCKGLQTISLPLCNCLSTYAFAWCTSLNNVDSPNTEVIGYNAFFRCTSLISVSFPKCKTVGACAFSACSNLTTALFENCTRIAGDAFEDCSNLSVLSIPNCETIIGEAFSGTRFLRNLFSTSSIARLSTKSHNFLIKACSYYAPSQFEDQTVTDICGHAFSGITALQSIFCNNCKYVDGAAFYNCTNLVTVSFPICSYVSGFCFNGCTKLSTISLPECTKICEYIFRSCTSLTSVSIPKCTYVERDAFEDCTSLSTISLPECSFIDGAAFYGCTNLISISVPKCSYFGYNIFTNCSALPTVSFPNCKQIWQYAFTYCSNLSTVYLLSTSVAQLGHSTAFQDCPALTNIYVPSSLVNTYKTATNWSFYSSLITAYGG